MKLADVDYLTVRMISISDLQIRLALQDGATLEFNYPTQAELSRDFEAWAKGDRLKLSDSINQ